MFKHNQPLVYVLLSCIVTLSLKFPTMFKPGEICHFIQGDFHLVTCHCHFGDGVRDSVRKPRNMNFKTVNILGSHQIDCHWH